MNVRSLAFAHRLLMPVGRITLTNRSTSFTGTFAGAHTLIVASPSA
jgi:hypothetical protein